MHDRRWLHAMCARGFPAGDDVWLCWSSHEEFIVTRWQHRMTMRRQERVLSPWLLMPAQGSPLQNHRGERCRVHKWPLTLEMISTFSLKKKKINFGEFPLIANFKKLWKYLAEFLSADLKLLRMWRRHRRHSIQLYPKLLIYSPLESPAIRILVTLHCRGNPIVWDDVIRRGSTLTRLRDQEGEDYSR